MQIALTKKLAEAMEIKPSPVRKVINPLFTWTANWTKVWDVDSHFKKERLTDIFSH